MKTKIKIVSDPKREEIEFISESLFQFNCEEVGRNDFKQIAIFLLDEQEQVFGGIIGWTRWDWAHIENLWIDEKYRGKGYGSQLLQEAENIAIERRCSMIDLDTFDFQAPIFYKRHGYKELFVLDGISKKHSKHFLKKDLNND